MTNNFTDQDLIDLRDGVLAEIGRRLKDPDARRSLTPAQLMAAAKELAKLTTGQDSSEDANLDLFELVERLPAPQRKKHLLAERVRLHERLARVRDALGESEE